MNNITKTLKKSGWCGIVLGIALAMIVVPTRASAQDQQEDPPSRVARLGYLQGSVSFQPAGETDWVGAVPNRPMSTGDQLWTDQDSRAEVQLGSAVIRLGANTGFSFLNLDDDTAQIQLTSGVINITVRRLSDDDAFEVDTPNQAFTIFQQGHYRVEASSDGSYTVISVRAGEGEATGNGETYTLHGGQRGTFSGTDSLNVDVVDIGGPDEFDTWSEGRDHRYDYSPSAQYLSHDVVGYEDLDDYGDWRADSNYGRVWFPNQVAVGWAPYHQGHWDWISPWGWTWVDDSSWGYAPFHYGRWVSVGGRWGRGSASGVCARAGGFYRRGAGGLRRQCGMVPAGSAGSLCAVVSRQPGVRESCQRQQYYGEHHHRHQCLQHDHHQQHNQYHEHYLRQPECPRRGDGGSAARVRECATGSESGGCSERARNRLGADEFAGCGGSDTRERAGCEGCARGSPGRAANSGSEPSGNREEDAAAAAGVFCETAAGLGSASRTTVSQERGADSASGQYRGSAANGEAGASRETGHSECGPAGQPAKRCTAGSTCRAGVPADESARQSAYFERAASRGESGAAESSIATAESARASTTEQSSGNESAK